MNFLILISCFIFSISVFAADSQGIRTPNISANALFLYRNSNFHKADTDPAVDPDQERNGFNIQEAELQFYSDVDPYTRLNLLLSVHPELSSDGTEVSESWLVEPEEAYIESNVISDVTLKLGKFKSFMGKHNLLHTHAFPFVLAPLTNQALLGDEGLNDVGLSAAYLFPTNWFSELTLQYLRGEGENSEFNSPTPGDAVGLVHWKNLFDLTQELTLEAGVSYTSGKNSLFGTTAVKGADLTFKWRPEQGGKYHSFIWSTEYLARNQSAKLSPTEKGSGIVSWFQYQFAERWAAFYRFDNLFIENTYSPIELPNNTSIRHSIGLAYMPSEFSTFKLEFDQRHGGSISSENKKIENALFLQANFTIGSHPSHSY